MGSISEHSVSLQQSNSAYCAWLIDPTTRTVASCRLPLGLGSWLAANTPSDFGNASVQLMRPLHHDLPMDAMMEFITEGQGDRIFANDLGNGRYLVLHDDVRDQEKEQPHFNLDYAHNREGPGREKRSIIAEVSLLNRVAN